MKEQPATTLLSPSQFCERHPAFTMPGMRHILFHRDTNGLEESGAVLLCGRKLLINEQRFLAWLDARNDIKEDRP